MKVTRIRKFPRKKISEITLRVSGRESEQICHFVHCDGHKAISIKSIAGLKLLETLCNPNGKNRNPFWTTWESDFEYQ